MSLNSTSKKGVARALGLSEREFEDRLYKETGVSYTVFKDQCQRINRLTRIRNLRVAELVEIRKLVDANGAYVSVYDDHSGVVHSEGKATEYLTPAMLCSVPTERIDNVPHWLLLDILESARRYYYDDYVAMLESPKALDGLPRMVINAPTVNEDLDFVVRYLQGLGLPIDKTDLKPTVTEHAAINLVAAEGGRWTGRARVFLHCR